MDIYTLRWKHRLGGENFLYGRLEELEEKAQELEKNEGVWLIEIGKRIKVIKDVSPIG